MSKKNQTLGEFIIENQASFKYTSGELSRLINSIRLAAKVVNHEVNKAGLVDIIGAAGDTNSDLLVDWRQCDHFSQEFDFRCLLVCSSWLFDYHLWCHDRV